MRPADGRARAVRPAPNPALRELLTETEWTQDAFARAIRLLGAEAGVRLSYNRTSVAHWLRGSRPSPHVQRFMAEALSRRLGRPVTVRQLGMGDGSVGGRGRRPSRERVRPAGAPGARRAAPGEQHDAHERSGPDDRGRGHPDPDADAHPPGRRRAFGNATAPAGEATPACDRLTALTAPVVGPPRADTPAPLPYRLELLRTVIGRTAAPSRTTPAVGTVNGPEAGETSEPLRPRPPRAPLPTSPRGGRPTRRTTPGEVASVREQVRFFAQQTDRHGGGHIRTPLAACLSDLVSGLRTGGEGPHHAQLLAASARLSYLLARVYADEQRQGLAQRAFVTAAELAREGGDPDGVALALRALGSQAHQLGHRRRSLDLAEAACATASTGRTAGPGRAFLFTGLAVARAACGERAPALDALRRAEYELARSPADLTTGPESPHGEPVGDYPHAALLYQASQVRATLGDKDGAIRELRASLRLRPDGERRSLAVSRAELAELLLARGRVEESCATWEVFLDDCALVRSGRARRARDRMPRLLRPYAAEDCVQSLSTRAGLALGGPSSPPPPHRTRAYARPHGGPREHPRSE